MGYRDGALDVLVAAVQIGGERLKRFISGTSRVYCLSFVNALTSFEETERLEVRIELT